MHIQTRFVLKFFLLGATLLWGCDPQRKSKCEWYLIPYPEGNNVMQPGWVSLCVANFKIGKKRCYFTAKPEFVEKFNGVPFRYDQMEYTTSLPKEILQLKTCQKS